MKRPAYLREDLYSLTLNILAGLPDDELQPTLSECGYPSMQPVDRRRATAAILETPSRFLACRCDILSKPDLLTGLFIEFDDDELDAGLTYFIDREAAEQIGAGDATILLRSGSTGVLMPRRRIVQAFAEGCVLDYKEDAAASR